MLAPLMVRGFTTPEKRINSVPWFMAICFSPTTCKLPFGRSLFTVTVMVPVKVLRAAAPPLPEKSLLPSALKSALPLPSQLFELPGMASNPIPADPLRLALAEELLLALTFS